jgi:Outer membrane efflux protein
MAEIRRHPPRRARAAVVALALAFGPPLVAAQVPETLPPPPVEDDTSGGLTIDEAAAIARQNHPGVAAAAASLAAAEAAQRGLQQLGIGGRLIARDLNVRRQQACLGVVVNQAALEAAVRDAECAARRTWLSAVYARQQERVARSVVTRLQATARSGETLLMPEFKDVRPADLSPVAIERARLFAQQAELRVLEARRGRERAVAALREALGLEPGSPLTVADVALPEVEVAADREAVVAAAVARRGEVIMTVAGAEAFGLEIAAQKRMLLPNARTLASGADLHVRPLPAGQFDENYRPGAVGPEMPPNISGPKEARVERATQLAGRAQEVVRKARLLVALEAEDAFIRYDAARQGAKLARESLKNAESLERKLLAALSPDFGGRGVSFRDALEANVLAAQLRGQLNEYLYQQASGAADLERVTAGAVAVSFPAPAPAKP